MTPKQLIEKHKLDKEVIARRIPMAPWAFGMKLLGTDSEYLFTSEELERLNSVLKEMGEDIVKNVK